MTDQTPYVRPDVRVLLDMLAAAPGPAITELSPAEARMGYQALHDMADRPARELAVIRDLSCPGPAGDIPLRLYDARESRGPGPVIVFYHGGGFVIGDLDTHHNLCTEIAHQMDLPVVAVDYRCAPEAPFPAAIEDCVAATRWVAGSPAELGRSATGLIPIGDSAGGNATIVVTQALMREAAAVPVVLQVPIFPLASDWAKSKSVVDFAEGYVLTRQAMEFFEAAYQPDKSDWRAMPIHAAHEREHRLGHLVAAAAAFGHHRGQLVQARIVAALGDQVGHDQQRLEDVAQVVAQAGGEQGQAFQPLAAHQFLLDPLPFGLDPRLAQGPLHRHRQARTAVLEDVVAGALAQSRHRHVLADRAGDEDEGDGVGMLADDGQGLVPGEPRHAQVRKHDVGSEGLQRPAQPGRVLHPHEIGVEVRVLQLELDQLRVLGRILDEQDPDLGVLADGAQRHRLSLRRWPWC